MGLLKKSTNATPEERAFLQRRVGLFGLTTGGCHALFLALRVVMDGLDPDHGIAGVVGDPTIWWHLLTALCFLATWAYCRIGTHSATSVHWAEALGLLGGTAAATAIAGNTPTHARPDMVLVLALSPVLLARTLFVPSSARRTLLLSVAVGVEIVAASYYLFLNVEPEKWTALEPAIGEMSAEEIAFAVAWGTAGYWMLTAVIATGASRVIYGLRRAVRDAKQFGQYVVQYKLGEGGMGAVYKARHALLRRPTAVKLVRMDRESQSNRRRFEKEVQQTARLSHPNIVTIFDYGHTPDGVFYYAMEYIDGITLSDLVQRHGPQPADRVRQVLVQLVGALVHAHGEGLIHRDIKPANVMLFMPHFHGGQSEQCKLLDFGLVKDLKAERGDEPARGRLIRGTPQYMSPESILNPDEVDGRSDLYGVGAVAYYMLSGEHVFEDGSLVEVMGQHMYRAAPPLSSRVRNAIPASFEQLIMGCLEKNPADRPGSARALLETLLALPDTHGWDNAGALAWWRTNQSHGEKETQGQGEAFTIDVQPSVQQAESLAATESGR